jgi:hypothetical protein
MSRISSQLRKYLMPRPGIPRRGKSNRDPFSIRLRFESLEDRRLLSLGDLLYMLDDPSTNLQQQDSLFGCATATDGNFTIVGACQADLQGLSNVGCVYIFNTTTGALVTTLNNPTPAADDYFGSSVAVSSNTVVVGAPYDDTGASSAGSAYIFDATTGNLLHTLANPTPAANDSFGVSVAVSGNTVVVGVYNDDTGAPNAGSAYIFDAATGNLLYTLDNPTPNTNDGFGYSVAVSGNIVVVGAYNDYTGATNTGAAYIFDAATGNLLRTLANPTPASNDYFGYAAAISGNSVIVGAYGDDTGATDTGAAYIFDATTGNLLSTLVKPTPATAAYFGNSVAVCGNCVVVGAMYYDIGSMSGVGAAYIFDAPTGNYLRTLANPKPGTNDFFGNSVAVSENTVVIGANHDHTSGNYAGEAYIFNTANGNLLHTLANPTPEYGNSFGDSVTISSNTVVVGAYLDDTGATDAGAAYIFDAATGNLLHTLANPTPSPSDHFGHSVAVSGNIVVVGAQEDNSGEVSAGSAYIFDAITGNLLRTLANPTVASDDHFGCSVAVSGNIVLVGACDDDTGAGGAGAAYIFNAATGSLLRTLANPTPQISDSFGSSVAVSGNVVVVGAWMDNTGATDAGAAYIFDAATGNYIRTLINPYPAAYDCFGRSVAVSGNTVVVGATGDDTSASNAGAVYIFDAATGNLLHTLTNPTPAVNDYFGKSVAVSGNTVVIGTYYDDTGATNAGAAYFFDATTGYLLRTLANPTPATEDRFGNSVAVSNGIAVVGTPNEDGITIDRGAAYFFNARLPQTITWDGSSPVDNYWTTKENWSGDLAPLPGDNLVFPAGAAQLNSVNNYPSTITFGSVTVSGSGYCFTNGVNSTTNITVRALKLA